MTASAHVLVFRPLIEILRGRGDEVEITSREYAQTQQLLELHGLESEVIGHTAAARASEGAPLARGFGFAAGRRGARRRGLAQGSHEMKITARRAGFQARTFDTSGRRCSTRSAAARRRGGVPEAIRRADREVRRGADQVSSTRVKEEYTSKIRRPAASRRARRRSRPRRRRAQAAAASRSITATRTTLPEEMEHLGRDESVHAASSADGEHAPTPLDRAPAVIVRNEPSTRRAHRALRLVLSEAADEPRGRGARRPVHKTTAGVRRRRRGYP